MRPSSAAMLVLLVGAAAGAAAAPAPSTGGVDPRPRCQRGSACWPTGGDVAALRAALDDADVRTVPVRPYPQPMAAGVPLGGPNAFGARAPFWGHLSKKFGGVDAVVVQNASEVGKHCFIDANQTTATPACLAAVRNLPKEGWTPAFVVWPLTASHVQAAVRFAAKHNLGVCVAATGHDFLNRHSCDQGVMIRTTLLKNLTFDADSGTATCGSGNTWGEVQSACAGVGRVVVTGHAATVGVIGWSIGGGHSFLSPWHGLGVDQMVSLDIVLASGELVTASASENSDLFWALRGGGGSAWGVITSITIKTYAAPAEGFTRNSQTLTGPSDAQGMYTLQKLVSGFHNWSLALSNRWGGFLSVSTPKSFVDNNAEVEKLIGKYGIHSCGQWAGVYGLTDPAAQGCDPNIILKSPNCDASCAKNPFIIQSICPATCGFPWMTSLYYEYRGSASDPEFVKAWANVSAFVPGWLGSVEPHYPTYWNVSRVQGVEFISAQQSSGAEWRSIGSVLLSRQNVSGSAWASVAFKHLQAGIDGKYFVNFQGYQTVPGNTDSPKFDPSLTSISSGFRHAHMHLIGSASASDAAKSVQSDLYKLGPNSYMSESQYAMPGDSWKARQWGDNYPRLLSLKKKYDPQSFFWCARCVGSDYYDPSASVETPAQQSHV